MQSRIKATTAILLAEDRGLFVYGYKPWMKLKKGFGYTHEGYVYEYFGRGTGQPDLDLPGIYRVPGAKQVYIIKPYLTSEEKEMYSINRIVYPDIKNIFEEITKNPENFMTADDAQNINKNGEIFTAEINDDDDFLKILVKKMINAKQISFANYRNKLSEEHGMTNMRTALLGKTKMSVVYFRQWCKALGVKWTIVLEDDGTDRYSSIGEPITYQSEDSIY